MTIDFHDIPFEFYIMLSIIFWVILEIVYVLLKSDLVEEVHSEDKYQISVYTHDESPRELTSHPKYLLCYIFYLSLIVFGMFTHVSISYSRFSVLSAYLLKMFCKILNLGILLYRDLSIQMKPYH